MRTPRPLPPALLHLAAAQEGLVTFAQCEAHGVDGGRVARLVRQGRLVPVTRGVYDSVLVPPRDRTGPGSFDHRRRRSAVAGLLAYGASAVATGACALALLGVAGLPVEVVPEVMLRDGGPRRRRDGVVARRYQGCSIGSAEGWPVVSVEDALVQTIPTLGRRRALAVLDSARHRGLVDADGVARAHERARGRPGVEHTHDVWGLTDERAESPVESVARLSCIDGELAPDALQLVLVDETGRFVARCDLAWWLGGTRWLVAEIDGEDPHSQPEALFHDRVRQNAMLAGGVQLVRVTGADAWRGALPGLVRPVLRRAGWEPGRPVPSGAVALTGLDPSLSA
ncbi:type IV toxin-antitoxin system AbiEi family antitoxin domain-containing protein [Xylanimonas sp. McL0601]|uniref:type IV toxin-antitoxin system AbiEi family antitoxin domain-containing protein n=1 Tax=Xylanimonas sp. McL0601 TaxID=3414739 RepID=UPI003CEB7482